jgi:hypothetical protein
MTQAQTKKTESDISTRPIEQWDDEGGAMQCVYGPVTKVLKYGPPSPLLGDANEPENLTFAEEEQILERLGAAVTMKWETLPHKTQRELFDHATSLADAMDKVHFTGQIARFLHDHKGSAFRPVGKN